MPIYSYKCNICGEIFDKMSKAAENKNVPCVHCNGDTMRVFSPVGIIFKGSGFYSTDYKNESKNKSPTVPSGEKTKKDSQEAKIDISKKSKPADKIKSSK